MTSKVQAQFLSTLFDEGQFSCFSESPHGYKVSSQPKAEDLFFCINALHPYRDLVPTKDWHAHHRPRRADGNVVCYRNFLIELDKGTLAEQASAVMDKVPITSVVYSGGKSLHFIISLKEPLVSAEQYRETAKRILSLFPNADRTCKNPSRLSRLPDVIRPETSKMQELRHLGTRVSNSELFALLPELPKPKPISADQQRLFVSPLIIEATLFPNDLIERLDLGGRNAFFYWLGNRLKESSLPPKKRAEYVIEAYDNLHDKADFELDEALNAARVSEDA
jgi:hypothetical protein